MRKEAQQVQVGTICPERGGDTERERGRGRGRERERGGGEGEREGKRGGMREKNCLTE